jgi:heptosyltransferase-1
VSEVRTPRSILIVRLGAMGDILHAMPAVAALRKVFSDTYFGWVVEQRWADLLSPYLTSRPGPDRPLVDAIQIVDTRRWRRSFLAARTRSELRGVRKGLVDDRGAPYSVAIDFQGLLKSAFMEKLSGSRVRFGFSKAWEWPAALLYTNKIDTKANHVVDRNFDLASAVAGGFGVSLPRDVSAILPCNSDIEAEATRKLEQFGLLRGFTILNPGAGWGAKQWPTERYADVARALGRDGVRSLVNFGPGEESLAKIVEDQAEGYAIAAQFTVSQLIAVTRRAALFIGGDTGPLHLAAALKIPVVALFGPTDPARTGPYGTRSIVLRDPSSITSHKRNRETEAGLKNISAEQVIAAARELLNAGARA